jgi:hypothetical protein
MLAELFSGRVRLMNGYHEEQETPERRWWVLAPPPWWCLLFVLAGMLGTAVWRVITGGTAAGLALYFTSLIWPGLAIGAVIAVVVWLGWVLDLD